MSWINFHLFWRAFIGCVCQILFHRLTRHHCYRLYLCRMFFLKFILELILNMQILWLILQPWVFCLLENLYNFASVCQILFLESLNSLIFLEFVNLCLLLACSWKVFLLSANRLPRGLLFLNLFILLWGCSINCLKRCSYK